MLDYTGLSSTFNPTATGAACQSAKDAPPNGDTFFSSVTCKGAFGTSTDNGDDAFDTDDGYVGKGQFLFAMTGSVGNHGAEMDSRFGSLPRSHPAFYGMTIVGAGALSTRAGNAMMRLREGTGGKFGNMILANATPPGIRIDTCSNSTGSAAPSIVSVLLASTTSLNHYLSFSSNNIIQSPTAGYDIVSPCTGTALTSVNATSVNADHRDERTNGRYLYLVPPSDWSREPLVERCREHKAPITHVGWALHKTRATVTQELVILLVSAALLDNVLDNTDTQAQIAEEGSILGKAKLNLVELMKLGDDVEERKLELADADPA
eukprot:jgi/Chrpa1/26343/Chrysochromulina_OHIO_Genome00025869-RA